MGGGDTERESIREITFPSGLDDLDQDVYIAVLKFIYCSTMQVVCALFLHPFIFWIVTGERQVG
jgi:hypothetical protein